MAYLQLGDRQIPLRDGETSIGASAGVDVQVDGVLDSAPVAVVAVTPAGIVLRRGPLDGGVTVNGVSLGGQPVPLIHGDRIEAGTTTLVFGDDAKGGSTAFLSGAQLAEMVRKREAARAAEQGAAGAGTTGAPRQPTAGTGGRLVSLVDGREYPILRKPFTIGRDPACDVVVASSEVSRSHAEIESGPDGYYLIDTSSNGVLVNGVRVDGTMTLARADVLRFGPEEFRFYADRAAPSAQPPATSPAAPAVAAAPPVAASATPGPTAAQTAAPAAAVAAPSGAASRLVLARLEIAGGDAFDLTEPMTQLGRGPHNDIVLVEDSVSDSHAKLQRRGDAWFVVDMGSTNGTFVAGARVRGEATLRDAAEVKFGSVRASFRVLGAAPVTRGGKGETAVLSSALASQFRPTVDDASARRPSEAPRAGAVATDGTASAAPRPQAARPSATPRPPVPPASRGIPVWVWGALVLVVAAAAYFLVAGR